MNKKMRELLQKIQEKTVAAKDFLSGNETKGIEKDVEKANKLLDEIDALKAEFEAEKRVFELEKAKNTPNDKELETKEKEKEQESSVAKMARAARAGFPKEMNEGTNADGGYTVPEDIQTQINTYKEAKASLLNLVRVEPVSTKSGARTFKKRSQQTGFAKVAEKGSIGAKNTPQFERVEYSISKYAGYFPVTNELLEDTDANLVNVLVEWIGDESRVTANKLILEKINTKEKVAMSGLDDIKKALNVTLGQAFKGTAKVITNDDGLQYLDTLKDSDGDYLLQPAPQDPMKMQLCAGATVVPVEVIPNADLASAPVYTKSTDSSVQSGKTYYTLSGSTYTPVAEPSGNPSTSNYYEVTATQIPMIIGDLYEAIYFFDRKQTTIMQSDVASIGDFNAFEQDLTLYRAIEREDVQLRDSEAFVNGYIQPGE